MPQLGPVELEMKGAAAESTGIPCLMTTFAAARGASIRLTMAFIFVDWVSEG